MNDRDVHILLTIIDILFLVYLILEAHIARS